MPTRLRHALASDFAIHGLAYAGILLLFVGLTGFVIFAFGAVNTRLRPVAELALPLAFFGVGAYLFRRGARVAATALTAAGGAALPVSLIAMVTDGSSLPPDCTGAALAIYASAAFALSGLTLWWLSTRSALRVLAFEVAPMAWLALAVLPAVTNTDLQGRDIAGISPAQVGVLAGAIALSVVLARLAPEARLTRPTLLVSGPGYAVALVLLAVTAAVDGWSAGALMAVGLAGMVTCEALSTLLPDRVVVFGMAGGLSLAAIGAGLWVQPGWAAAIGTFGAIGLLEWQGARRPSAETIAVTAVPALAGLLAAVVSDVADPWAVVTAAGLAGAWAHGRRARPVPWLPPVAADAAAGVLPLVAAGALFTAMAPWTAAVVVAVVVAGAVVAGRVTRQGDDRLLSWWLPTVAAASAVPPGFVALQEHGYWLAMAATTSIATVAVAIGFGSREMRLWVASASGSVAALLALQATTIEPRWQATIVAVTGAFVMLAAARLPLSLHVGAVGLALGVGGTCAALGLGADGWSSTVALVSVGAAILLAAELLSDRLNTKLVCAAMPAGTAVALVGLGLQTGAWWAASAAVVLYIALLEWQLRRRPTADATAFAAAGALAGLGVTLLEVGRNPWPFVVASTTAAVWSHARRFVRPPQLPAIALDVSAAALPVAAGAALFFALDPWVAAVAVTSAAVVASVAARVARLGRDVWLAWWLPAATTLAGAAAVATAFATDGWWLLLATATASVSVAVATGIGRPVYRLWLSAPVGVAAGLVALQATSIEPRWQAAAVAVLGAVALSMASRRLTLSANVAALGLIGEVAGTSVAVAIGGLSGAQTTIPLAALWLSMVVVAVRVERGGDPFTAVAVRMLRLGDPAASWAGVAALAMAPVVAVSALDTLGSLDATPWRAAMAITVVAMVEVLAARWLPARLQYAAIDVGTLGMLVAVPLCAAEPWPRVIAVAGVVALLPATPARLRRPWTAWLSWLASASLVVQLAERSGVAVEHLHRALAAWGMTAVVGALVADRVKNGSRVTPGWARSPSLQPPATLGATACIACLGGLVQDSELAAGLLLLTLGVTAAAVTVLTAIGPLAGVAAGLLTVGTALAVPFNPLAYPWTLVGWAAALCVCSFGFERRPPRSLPIRGHDVAAFAVGVITAAIGVVAAPVADAVSVTWLAAAVLALGIWVWRQELGWLVASVALADAAAASEGLGWLTLAMAVTTVLLGIAAWRSTGRIRAALQVVTAASAAGTWVVLGAWLGVSGVTAAVATALLGGVLSLVAGVLSRVRLSWLDWAWTLAGLGGVGVAAAAGAQGWAAEPRTVAVAVAAGLLGVAVCTGLMAAPTRLVPLRYMAVASGLLAGGELWFAAEPSDTTVTAVALTVSALATLLWLSLHLRAHATDWILPAVLVSVACTAVALVMSLMALPRRDLLVASLVVIAMEAAAAGLATRWLALQLAPVPLLAAAWFTATSDSLTGHAVWHLVPLGVVLLAESGIARSHAAASGEGGTPTGFSALELVGIGFVVAPPLVEMALGHLVFVVAAVTFGAIIAVWGVTSRVRRRALAGAGAVLAAILLLIVVPLVELASSGTSTSGDVSRSAMFWLGLAGVGLAVFLVAIALEQGRARARRAVARLRELTAGWE